MLRSFSSFAVLRKNKVLYEITLAYFPKKGYFLEQENGKNQENTDRKRDDQTTPKGYGLTASALFSLFGK